MESNMKDEDYAYETRRQKELDSYPAILFTEYSPPRAKKETPAQSLPQGSQYSTPVASNGTLQGSNGGRVGAEEHNRIPARAIPLSSQRRFNGLHETRVNGTQASGRHIRPDKGIRVEVAPARFLRKDPNPGIPFVDVYPPSAGVTYWLVCAVVIGGLGALAYLGV